MKKPSTKTIIILTVIIIVVLCVMGSPLGPLIVEGLVWIFKAIIWCSDIIIKFLQFLVRFTGFFARTDLLQFQPVSGGK